MIAEEFLKLPPYVYHEGIEFVPSLIMNGETELRLVYKIGSVAFDSKHKATIEIHDCWNNNLVDPGRARRTGYLVLYENIMSDADLIWAIRDCWHWLVERNLIDFSQENTET